MQDSVGAVFAALADHTRREVVTHLSAEGPATPTELANRLPVTRQAVAKHLAALRSAGLVAVSREGREVRYRLTPAPLAEAMTWMVEVGAEWDRRLDALRRLLAEEDEWITPSWAGWTRSGRSRPWVISATMKRTASAASASRVSRASGARTSWSCMSADHTSSPAAPRLTRSSSAHASTTSCSIRKFSPSMA